MRVLPPSSMHELRDLMRSNPAMATNEQRLALVIAKSTARSGRKPGIALAEELLDQAGGLAQLVAKICDNAIDLHKCGAGESIAARIIACMELAQRWRDGFTGRGQNSIGTDNKRKLQSNVFRRAGKTSPAGMMAVILSASSPAIEVARGVVKAFGSADEVMRSFSFGRFCSFRKGTVSYIRHLDSDLEIEFAAACRLLAAVDLARSYLAKKGPKALPLKDGMFGLKDKGLVALLNPAHATDPKFRDRLIETLRAHQNLGSDFAIIARLATDAGVQAAFRAVELNLMFEELRKVRTWAHPSEVLGEQAPISAMLGIAQARIKRTRREPTRLLQMEVLLRQALQEIPGGPIDSFVEALAQRKLVWSVAKKAIEEAKRRYLEKFGDHNDAQAPKA